MDTFLGLLQPVVMAVIGGAITFLLTRRKNRAEIRNLNARSEKTVSEAAISLYKELQERLNTLEESRRMEKAFLEKEIQRLSAEIELLKKENELVTIELKTANARLGEALKFSAHNELLARDFYAQLRENGITPVICNVHSDDLFPVDEEGS